MSKIQKLIQDYELMHGENFIVRDAITELDRLQEIEKLAMGLVEYRRRVGPLNFQLEKADDFIQAMAAVLLNGVIIKAR